MCLLTTALIFAEDSPDQGSDCTESSQHKVKWHIVCQCCSTETEFKTGSVLWKVWWLILDMVTVHCPPFKSTTFTNSWHQRAQIGPEKLDKTRILQCCFSSFTKFQSAQRKCFQKQNCLTGKVFVSHKNNYSLEVELITITDPESHPGCPHRCPYRGCLLKYSTWFMCIVATFTNNSFLWQEMIEEMISLP